MWNHIDGSGVRPQELDTTSSKKFVYVRKNIVLVEETEERGAHYEWDEAKIAKEDWEVYEQVLAHDTALDDVYAALTELAELIGG